MSIATTRIARDVAFTLEKKSPDIFENIFLNNGVLAALGSKGRVKIVRGGNRFDERVHLGENSTVDYRSKFAQIPTDMQNNWKTAQYGMPVISGTGVINLVEQQQNQGDSAISSLASATLEEANNTFPNQVANALMATTSGATDPESIVERIEAAPYGSQSSSLGGISRGDHTGAGGDATDAWQNQYSNTAVADLGAAEGIGEVTKFAYECSPGGSAKNQQPDIGLTTIAIYAKATGGGDANRRYTVDSNMLDFGFDNIKFNNASIIADRNVAAGKLYLLNTNYLRLQVLAGENTKVVGNVKVIGDGKASIPLQVSDAVEADDYLMYTVKMWLVANLTFGGLRQHGVMDNITGAE